MYYGVSSFVVYNMSSWLVSLMVNMGGWRLYSGYGMYDIDESSVFSSGFVMLNLYMYGDDYGRDFVFNDRMLY